jgi:hypothetical protein
MIDHCERCLELEFDLAEQDKRYRDLQNATNLLAQVLEGFRDERKRLGLDVPTIVTIALARYDALTAPQPVEQIAREG